MTVLKRGDRVRITGLLPDDPAPLPIGTEGVVHNVMNQSTPLEQIGVDWEIDPPRSLMLLPTDPFEVVPPKRRAPVRRTRATKPPAEEG